MAFVQQRKAGAFHAEVLGFLWATREAAERPDPQHGRVVQQNIRGDGARASPFAPQACAEPLRQGSLGTGPRPRGVRRGRQPRRAEAPGAEREEVDLGGPRLACVVVKCAARPGLWATS